MSSRTALTCPRATRPPDHDRSDAPSRSPIYVAEKGHDVLIDAIASRPQLGAMQFEFAGDGPCREALERRARERGVADQVTFLGERQDIPRLLEQADLFILPSLTEALPNSVMEAMAAGLPIIASHTGGIPELIEDDVTGLLVASGSVDDLGRGDRSDGVGSSTCCEPRCGGSDRRSRPLRHGADGRRLHRHSSGRAPGSGSSLAFPVTIPALGAVSSRMSVRRLGRDPGAVDWALDHGLIAERLSQGVDADPKIDPSDAAPFQLLVGRSRKSASLKSTN